MPGSGTGGGPSVSAGAGTAAVDGGPQGSMLDTGGTSEGSGMHPGPAHTGVQPGQSLAAGQQALGNQTMAATQQAGAVTQGPNLGYWEWLREAVERTSMADEDQLSTQRERLDKRLQRLRQEQDEGYESRWFRWY